MKPNNYFTAKTRPDLLMSLTFHSERPRNYLSAVRPTGFDEKLDVSVGLEFSSESTLPLQPAAHFRGGNKPILLLVGPLKAGCGVG